MKNERRTMVLLLSAIAVLLGLNLVVMGTRRAEAESAKGNGEPYVVDYTSHGPDETVWQRLWSDGQIDEWGLNVARCESQFNGVRVPPVEHTAVKMGWNRGTGVWWIAFADGRLDTYRVSTGIRCVCFGESGELRCLGDIDRDGTTGMSDLLITIQDWGCTSE